MMGGYQITYFGHKGKPEDEPGVIRGAGVDSICSVIESPMSYGHEEDLLELSGLLTEEEYKNDSVKGYMTAEEVYSRIKKLWLEES
jgi:hypothetical protein